MATLTRKQAAVYAFLVDELVRTQHWPTMCEIAAHFGWRSPNAAQTHIDALVRKGWLWRDGAGRLRLSRHRLHLYRGTAVSVSLTPA